jgi:DNA-binding Lrp family transcriptional regulator
MTQTQPQTKAGSDLDLLDRQILNLLQSEFPLVERPFAHIGEAVGISEPEAIDRVNSLKRRNVVRQIGAIFDTRRLGYKTSLIAMNFPADTLDAAAQKINEHPGVSHNYARVGQFNLWFTVAVPPEETIEGTVERMAKETGALSVRVMPTIKFFKIGVNFDMVKEEGAATDYFSPDGIKAAKPDKSPEAAKSEKPDKSPDQNPEWNKAQVITEDDRAAIRELQEDLPLVKEPFTPMAERLGMTVDGLFAKAAELVDRGLMRRYSAVLHHRRAGFGSNAMAVWRVPQERSTEVGNIMASSKWVTHCYERPTFPDWPYTHFSMIHATSDEQCEQVVGEISEATGIDDYKLLYSTREYKKTRVRYFV